MKARGREGKERKTGKGKQVSTRREKEAERKKSLRLKKERAKETKQQITLNMSSKNVRRGGAFEPLASAPA